MLDSSHHRAKSEERRAKSSRAWLGTTEGRFREQISPRLVWMHASVPTEVGTCQGPWPQNPGHYAPDSSGFTRNHAAYNAGRNTSVSTVPTIRPPMIEIAIEP